LIVFHTIVSGAGILNVAFVLSRLVSFKNTPVSHHTSMTVLIFRFISSKAVVLFLNVIGLISPVNQLQFVCLKYKHDGNSTSQIFHPRFHNDCRTIGTCGQSIPLAAFARFNKLFPTSASEATVTSHHVHCVYHLLMKLSMMTHVSVVFGMTTLSRKLVLILSIQVHETPAIHP